MFKFLKIDKLPWNRKTKEKLVNKILIERLFIKMKNAIFRCHRSLARESDALKNFASEAKIRHAKVVSSKRKLFRAI